jgi:hypothetical protein
MLESPKADSGIERTIGFVKSFNLIAARSLRYLSSRVRFTSVFKIYVAFATFLTMPLVVASILRPLAYWDYIAVFQSLIPIAPQDSWRTLWPNFAIQFTSSSSRFFPSYLTFYQLLLVLFHGEYWAAFLVKWLLKLAAAYLVVLLVRRVGGSKEGALFGATFLFFHPAPFELTLYMTDGLTAMLMLLLAFSVLDRGPDEVYRVDLAALSRLRYMGALAVWLLLLGMKESAVALAVVFLIFWLIDPRGKLQAARIVPFCIVLMYAIYRVGRIAGGGIALSPERVAQKFWAYVDFLDPVSVDTLPGKLLLAGVVILVVMAFRDKSAHSFHSPLWLFLGLAGTYLAFISIPVQYPPWETPRYVVPVVAALSVLVGVGASRVFRRRPTAIIPLIFFVPALTAGDIYTQNLALNKQLDEFSVILNRLVDCEAQGYTALKMPAAYPETEPDVTVRRFLEVAGRHWYGLNPKAPVAVDMRTDWSGPGVLVTRIPPATFLSGGFPTITKDDILWIETVEKTHLGGFEYLTAFWQSTSRILGDHVPPRYDVGTLPVDSVSTWFLYGFRKTVGVSGVTYGESVAPTFGVLSDGSRLPLTGVPGRPQVLEHSGRGYFSLTIPLKLGKGGWQLVPQARIAVKRGSVYFGLGAGLPNTATYWNVKLDAGKVYDPLPLPWVIHADGNSVVTAFLFAPVASDLLIEAANLQDMNAIPVRMARPTSRFGAFIR